MGLDKQVLAHVIEIPAAEIPTTKRVRNAIALDIVTVFIGQVLSGLGVFNAMGNDIDVHRFAKMNNSFGNGSGILVIMQVLNQTAINFYCING